MKLDKIVESEWESIPNTTESIKHLYYFPTEETKKECPRAYQVTFTRKDTEQEVISCRRKMEEAIVFYKKNGYWEN